MRVVGNRIRQVGKNQKTVNIILRNFIFGLWILKKESDIMTMVF